jgi:hypothetical protein
MGLAMSSNPPLPEPRLRFEVAVTKMGERLDYTAEQMRAYGEACAAAEREACAMVVEALRERISDPLLIGEEAHHAGMNALANAADAIRARGET